MRSLKCRVDQLEYRSGGGIHKQRILIWVWGSTRLALPRERIMEILQESGHLPDTSHSVAMVMPLDIPDGLNAEELERYLRERGDELRVGSERWMARQASMYGGRSRANADVASEAGRSR